MQYCMPGIAFFEGGVMIALKGEDVQDELQELQVRGGGDGDDTQTDRRQFSVTSSSIFHDRGNIFLSRFLTPSDQLLSSNSRFRHKFIL